MAGNQFLGIRRKIAALSPTKLLMQYITTDYFVSNVNFTLNLLQFYEILSNLLAKTKLTLLIWQTSHYIYSSKNPKKNIN